MSAPDYGAMTEQNLKEQGIDWLRAHAGIKIWDAGYQKTFVKQKGRTAECVAYLKYGIWGERWGEPVLRAKVKQKGEVAAPFLVDEYTLPLFGSLPVDTEAVAEATVDHFDLRLSAPAALPDTVETAYEAHYRLTGKGRHPDVVRKEKEADAVKAVLPFDGVSPAAVKTASPRTKHKKQKGMLANGRDCKGVSKFENWFGRVYPVDLTYPAWRALTKPQTDIANICRAKHDHAAHMGKKDSTGRPVFEFLVSEAEGFFKFTRPTFLAGIEHLAKIGFIERVVHGGGVVDGKGIKSLYRLSENWKAHQPELKKYPNMDKARKEMLRKREAKKQNPS